MRWGKRILKTTILHQSVGYGIHQHTYYIYTYNYFCSFTTRVNIQLTHFRLNVIESSF
jgi:hypothetical protein